MRCAPRASNGPDHLGLSALQVIWIKMIAFEKRVTAGEQQKSLAEKIFVTQVK